jgi:hypothetical protein
MQRRLTQEYRQVDTAGTYSVYVPRATLLARSPKD